MMHRCQVFVLAILLAAASFKIWASGPPVISSVTVSGSTSSSGMVNWKTDILSTSQVRYGTSTAYGLSTPQDPTLVISHRVTLSSLTPNTLYHFQVLSTTGSSGAASGDFTFTTLAAPPPVISAIKVPTITPTSSIITWVTDQPADSQVDYGLTTAYGSSTPRDGTLVSSHTRTLSGLTPNALYHFRVRSRDGFGHLVLSNDYDFVAWQDAPPSPTQVHFAAVGDYGTQTQAEGDVERLIRSWNPDFIITLGDNNYNLGDRESIDAHIGQFYHNYIFPYSGGFGGGATSLRFFPCLGNHDIYTTERPLPYSVYFPSLPGNGRYYDFTRGPVHFFVLDSESDYEPDGIDFNSIQGRWLKNQIALSTEPYKFVYFHEPPYTSGNEPPNLAMAWPFKDWGITAVLSGHQHDYERIMRNDYPLEIISGTGGASFFPLQPNPAPGTLARIANVYGAMKVDVDAGGAKFQFISPDTVVQDAMTIQPSWVTISSPATGASLTGNVSIQTSVSNALVNRVEFDLDGIPQSTLTAAPYNFAWDSSEASNGPHLVTVKAYDPAGNYNVHMIAVTLVNADPSRQLRTEMAPGYLKVTGAKFKIYFEQQHGWYVNRFYHSSDTLETDNLFEGTYQSDAWPHTGIGLEGSGFDNQAVLTILEDFDARVRLKVTGVWASPFVPPDPAVQFQTFFTLYPDGKMFVEQTMNNTSTNSKGGAYSSLYFNVALTGAYKLSTATTDPLTGFPEDGMYLINRTGSFGQALLTGLYEPYTGNGSPFFQNNGNGLLGNTFPPLTKSTYHLLGVFSNTLTGINSGNAAKPLWDDYRTPDTLTFAPGAGSPSGTGFDPSEGAYTVMAGSAQTQFTLHGQALARVDPIFKLFNYFGAVPSTMTVGGSVKRLDRDYDAIKLNSSTLLIQYLATVNQNSVFTIQTSSPLPPPVISSVTTLTVGQVTAVVGWQTDRAADSQVLYGTSTSYGFFVSTTTLVSSHTLTLTGLTPSTTYHYQVRSTDNTGALSASGDFTLITLPIVNPPPVISSVIVSGISQSSATITWITDHAADSQVLYGTSTAYGFVVSSPTLVSNHTLTLTGLTPSTIYHYQSGSTDIYGASSVTGDFTFQTPGSSSPPTQGLLGYWNFDEGSGTLAHDSSGNSNTATINGVTWTAGKINSALSFNGSTSDVVTPPIALSTAFSVSVWVNPALTTQGMFSRIAETHWDSGLYVGTDLSGAKYKVIVNSGSGSTGSCGASYGCVEGGAITSGWHLVTATYDGAIAKLYVDNAMVASDTFNAPGNTNYPLYIGRYYGSTGYGWNGALDEVRLYNRALTSAEVSVIYSFTGGPPDTTPPTVSITAPTNGATISGVTTLSATASDNVAVANVQLQLDSVNLGPQLTASPYQFAWDTTGVANGTHTLAAVATDTSINSTTSAGVSMTLNNTVSSPPTLGLLGYWNFDEGSGTLAHDRSGSGYTGSINGATWTAWTAGKINSALSFNGSTSDVVTPPIALNNAFSVSVWVNPALTTQGMFSRIAETHWDSGLYVGTDASGTKYKVIVNSGSGSTGSCGASYGCAEGGAVTSGWHLVTATYDGAIANLYVDNAVVASDTFNAPANTTYPLYIGRYYGSTGYGWNGALDEVRLYNRALTSAEASAIYTTR